MRRICQPRSRSRPHVTVRYARRELPEFAEELYDQVWLDRIYLSGPDTFDAPSNAEGLSTLFVRCESEQLERLSYKPDFPDSVFHLTLYDGRPSQFAEKAYLLLCTFDWHLEVKLPPSHVEPIRKIADAAGNTLPRLTPAARQLLGRVTNGDIKAESLLRIGDDVRLELLRLTCYELHSMVMPSSPEVGKGIVHNHGRTPPMAQGELWSFFDLIRDSGVLKPREAVNRDHRRNGLYITPPEIASDMVACAHALLPSQSYPIDFGDPAVGSGIFVAALVGEFNRGDIRSAIGVEADERRSALTAERWRHIGLEVNSDDFVERILGDAGDVNGAWLAQKRNLVIANPPYVRSQGLDAARVSHWRSASGGKVGLVPDARSDLYVYFIFAAHTWLEAGGVAMWLLPTEFMFTRYGQVLRKYLLEKVDLIRVHVYGGPSQFSNARVSSCVVLYRKSHPQSTGSVAFTQGGTLMSPVERVSVPWRDLNAEGKWQRIFQSSLQPVGTKTLVTIGDLFVVRRGIATGANRFFVISQELVDALQIPARWRKPVLPKAFLIPSGVIEADNQGNPGNIPFSWLIDCDAHMAEIAAEAPFFAEYLKEIEMEVGDRELVRRRKPFYRQEANRPPRFVFTYMARQNSVGKRFRLNRSNAVALNNYLCLYPLAGVETWLAASVANELLLLDALRSVGNTALKANGREYSGGLIKLEPRELRDLSLAVVPLGLIEALT
ncbi:Modification methylase PaeR7I [Mycolicibacterium vanbaalenii]|uniref:site-specific DNA-methyltransferase (adenine-specific) n=2 Tax=Mycolicibacterium vanbaalenii TaxID=110539 RepID=A0A5S9QI81_MYCVN|nr:Modification methylase PaeR7I [Mycolicibacterium vanbaalenii]